MLHRQGEAFSECGSSDMGSGEGGMYSTLQQGQCLCVQGQCLCVQGQCLCVQGQCLCVPTACRCLGGLHFLYKPLYSDHCLRNEAVAFVEE